MSGVNVKDIRATFLDFFQANGHELVASSPLVPHNDPSLMFTNAGMVQFKNVFTGLEKRNYTRAVSSQKCVRAGGKHNDLDNVGYTARHHTFFEMLGNFSFGDYFKAEAIELAWRLLTKEFGLPPERLLVTVFAEDEEAFTLWKKITGFPDDKIIRIATSDNFWSMGETGPCGPCSEIFYDHGEDIPGGPPGSPDQDGDRFVEIWNLVFMQYEQLSPDQRIPLPHPSIDTGMGLERIAAVLQGTHDNYEIDLFRALIDASVNLTGREAVGEAKFSHRVIADHLRSSSFLIADGVLPSNEGRGYVLRRIMRRAMRHAHLLGAKEPLIYQLVPELLRQMGQAFPELLRAEALISETLKLEEQRFRKTLSRGLHLLEEATAHLKPGDSLAGEVAFKLYDTYGFPLDLTEDALKARQIRVDRAGFDAAMAQQRAEARKAWVGSGEVAEEKIWLELRDKLGATEFLGYTTEQAEGTILTLVKDGKVVTTLKNGEKGAVIVNQSPFYGEAGGQVGDRGMIRVSDGGAFEVTDTQKKASDLLIHFGVVRNGTLKTGQTAELEVDHARRQMTRSNHSATHLLHEALRQVLGDHVAQKGSLVEPGRLRFDFSHPKPMTPEEIEAVERLANTIMLQNTPVVTRLMSVDDAIAAGALALFGEKYGDEVRVVAMGQPIEPQASSNKASSNSNKAWWSMELCGGTHVNRTGDIGLIKITAETAVAAGIRRIEAVTGETARQFLNRQDQIVRDAAELMRVPPADLLPRLEGLIKERRKLERQLAELKRKAIRGNVTGEQTIQEMGGIRFLARTVRDISLKELRSLVDEGKRDIGSGVVAIVGISEEGKAGVAVGVTDDLTSAFNAVDLVKAAARALGGKGGGGRPDMAQAGGPNAEKADQALEIIADFIREKAAA